MCDMYKIIGVTGFVSQLQLHVINVILSQCQTSKRTSMLKA